MKPPYHIDNTPVYFRKDEDAVLGRANKNGTIVINENVRSPEMLRKVFSHERTHIDQIKSGLIWYDDKYMYHRKSPNKPWKKVKRSKNSDGNKKHWWEKEAWKNTK